MVDHMHDQPQETINKVLPMTGFAVQATLEQVAIDFRQGHGVYL